jgi:hypothetical protein
VRKILCVIASIFIGLGTFTGVASSAESPTLVSTATFTNQNLKTVSNRALPNSVGDDFDVKLGGMGSDLFRTPGAASGEYWVVTDRGPNVDTTLPTGGGATGFLVPDFSPLILQITVSGEQVTINKEIAIRTRKGNGVTGLPNIAGYDAIPSDIKGLSTSSLYNLNGLDVEGLVRTRNGEFWVVEEYGPSLARISSQGVLLERWVPEGWAGQPTDYKVNKTMPGIYLKRKANRGFEALAMSPDEKTLFIGLQSPLLNPTTAVGNASRMTRILRFDISSRKFSGEFLFPFELPQTVDKTTTKTTELKLSALVALDSDTLLVQERTDNSFLVSTIDLKESANILGSKWDSLETTPSLETWAQQTPEGVSDLIASLNKKIVLDSTSIPSMPGKVEGMAVLDDRHLVFINDNDFNFTYNKTTGRADTGANLTKILTVKLPASLPTYPDVSKAHLGGRCLTPGSKANDLICTDKNGSVRWRNG